MKNVAITIKALYESCDRITLYVAIVDADSPIFDTVPCYSGRNLRDALQQMFQLADFFNVERPNTDHLIAEKLYSALELEEALNDVEDMVNMLSRNRKFQKEKFEKRNK